MEQSLEKQISVKDTLRSVRDFSANWLEKIDGLNYRAKIYLRLTGIYAEPCQRRGKSEGCRWPREGKNSKIEPDVFCCLKCGYPMDISVMNLEQIEIYKKNRTIENKKPDFLKFPGNEPLYLAILPEKEISEIIKKVSEK